MKTPYKVWSLLHSYEAYSGQEHLDVEHIRTAVAQGKLVQGRIRFDELNAREAKIFDNTGGTVVIQGRRDINRAMEGDLVAVEKYPATTLRKLGADLVDADDSDFETCAKDDAASGPGMGGHR